MIADRREQQHGDALAVGEREADEFRRQSTDFDAIAGLTLHVASKLDHFEVSFTLGQPEGLLSQLVMAQIDSVR